jgi:hypothetical protein
MVFAVGSLLATGELRLARGSLTETRVWLIREPSNEGLGLSTGRIVDGGTGRVCVESRVRFFLWTSDAPPEPTEYCGCYERDGEGWREVGECP